MKRESHETTYARGRFGLDQNLVLLAALSAFVIAFAFGTINDRAVGKRFGHLKDTAPTQSPEKLAELAGLAAMPDRDVDLTGSYVYRVDYGAGHVLQGDVSIDETTVRRSLVVNHHAMFGQANYTIEGSTIQYSDIKGDRYLFTEAGTAIGADEQYGTYLELDGDVKLFIETTYTEGQYKPLVKASPVIVERLRHMSVWAILQLASLLTGVSILTYVLIKLIVNRKTPPRQTSRESFAA